MPPIVSLDRLAEIAPSGARVGIGGVHLSRLPVALIEKILALGRRDFTFISWGGGLPLELFLQAGAVKKVAFCFSSLDIFGLAPRFREALEQGRIEVEEWSALAMIQALHSAQYNLPEMPFPLPLGSEIMKSGDFWKESRAAFGAQPVGQARRLDIDVLLLHAQRADHKGNVEIQGARGLDLSMLGAAKSILVTVEEVVEVGKIGESPRSFALPGTFVTALAAVPGGAYPTSCLPYYSTDYSRLLGWVRGQQVQRQADSKPPRAGGRLAARYQPQFVLEPSRRGFLSAAARIRSHDVTTKRLDQRLLGPAESATWSIDELMVTCLAREYDNASICSVGSVSPLAMVSYMLAKRTHAPGLTIIALNGGFIDIDVHPMSLTLAEPMELETAKVCWGGDETYHWYYQSGRITHEVITVAQIDVKGRTNNAWITSHGKRIRLPGQGGMADVANLHKNFLLYLTRHSPERFVESVAFCTASRGLLGDEERRRAGLFPGKVRLITDLGIFELDPTERRFRLISLHPKVELSDVRRQTGGDFLVADPLAITEKPTPEQLRLIRQEIDPFGIRRLEFVPGKERLGMIEAILASEAAEVADVSERSA